MQISFRIWSSSLHRFSRELLKPLSFLTKFMCCRRKKPKMLASAFNRLSPSFASMEVSNQFKQVFKFMDINGDGKISPLELSEFLSSLGHRKSIAAQEAEGMVREMDCNGDGLVDLDEFMKAMVSKHENGGISKEEDDLMEAFLIFDTDKNGFISAEELQKVLVGLGSENCSLRDCCEMIRGVDMDGDGFVNFEEFTSMMTAACSQVVD